jgi:glycerol kinase
LAIGFWQNEEALRENWGVGRTFRPEMDEERRKELYKGWQKAVERTLNWVDEEETETPRR